MRTPVLLGLVAMLPSACKQAAEIKDSRPNIVFIMADDHAFQAISAYGHPISQYAPTPNIDKLARRGMIFTQAFVENSISAPSRATLLTGMYSHHHGQRTLQYGIMDSSLVHFPELLQQAGYRTALIGKWHLSFEPKGFDYYDILQDQGEYYNPVMRTSHSQGAYLRQEGYVSRVITDHALAWLEEHQEAPFCLMIHHKSPHRNWMAEPKYLDLYEEVVFPEPATLFDDYATRGAQMQEQQLTIDRHMGYAFDFKVEQLKDEPTLQYIHDSWPIAMATLSEEERKLWDASYLKKNESFLKNRPTGDDLLRWKYQRYIHDYCRTIRSVDDEVGRVIEYLDQHQLSDNTLIVYTSDQGFLLGEHGLYDKRFMYEESFRTPLLMSWPGHIPEGSECRELVQNIDLAPTFLTAAQVEVPDNMDGSSLTALFEHGTSRDWRQQLYYQFHDYPAVGNVRAHYGIRDQRYKLIHWYCEGLNGDAPIDSWELFDLEKDPHEVNNLIDHNRYSGIRDRLRRDLEQMRMANGAQEADLNYRRTTY